MTRPDASQRVPSRVVGMLQASPSPLCYPANCGDQAGHGATEWWGVWPQKLQSSVRHFICTGCCLQPISLYFFPRALYASVASLENEK